MPAQGGAAGLAAVGGRTALRSGMYQNSTKEAKPHAIERQAKRIFICCGGGCGLGIFRRVQPVSLRALRPGGRVADGGADAAVRRGAAADRRAPGRGAAGRRLPPPAGRFLAAGLCPAGAAFVPVHLSSGHPVFQLCHGHGAAEPERGDDGGGHGPVAAHRTAARPGAGADPSPGGHVPDRHPRPCAGDDPFRSGAGLRLALGGGGW